MEEFESNDDEIVSQVWEQIQTLANMRAEYLDKRWTGIGLERLLRKTSQQHSTLPHDRIYRLLGLADPRTRAAIP